MANYHLVNYVTYTICKFIHSGLLSLHTLPAVYYVLLLCAYILTNCTTLYTIRIVVWIMAEKKNGENKQFIKNYALYNILVFWKIPSNRETII